MQATIDATTVLELSPALHRYALRKVGREELAQDLVQETWAAALTSAASFQGRSSLKTWLTSILRRKIVDQHRRKRPSVSFDDALSRAPQVERERLDDAAATEFLLRELDKLPPREQEAVRLTDVEGLDRDVVAARMDVRRDTLRVLLHRGRHKLRARLESAGFAAA